MNNKFCYDYPKADVTSSVIAYSSGSNGCYAVVVRRKNNPFKNHLALPGGFLEIGKENLEECAVRELKEETGIDISIYSIEPFCVSSNPDRDPRGVVIDHVYSVEINIEHIFKMKAGDDASSLELVYLPAIYDDEYEDKDGFAFDHENVLKYFYVEKFLKQNTAS